jgi:hypothetical protein
MEEDEAEDESITEDTLLSTDEAFAIIAGDELTSLHKAKTSIDWPAWNTAMHEELDLLKEKGTWKLVLRPLGITPLGNKWTFVKKRNKAGLVIRHKARLVVKGCRQRYGHDYV